MTFEQLGLRPELTEAVALKGYQTPSPIQAQAIPAVLEGRDVLGGAQTGTGKTAAFALPLLQRLAASNQVAKRPRALILAPTRELAAQVHQSIVDYGRRLELRSAVIFGGVGFGNQISALRRGLDIIVATPGRLLDLCQQREANLSSIETLVLDEADRMLDMGFIHDIRKILAMLPQKRQNLFFSATYSKDVKKLADSILHNPVEVEVAPRNATADLVDQEVYEVGQKAKRELLSDMIKAGDWHQVLVFTRTKHGANRLATQLEKDGIAAMAIHGNKSQGARERALAAFKANDIRALVATDIAARGLDIANLPHVVNYELPNIPEDYVHRIGRTGRAGNAGTAISLVCESETEFLWDIEKLLKRELPHFALDRDGNKKRVERRMEKPSTQEHARKPGHHNRGPKPSGNRNSNPNQPRDGKHGHEARPTRSATTPPSAARTSPASAPKPASSLAAAPAPAASTAAPARRRNRWSNRRPR